MRFILLFVAISGGMLTETVAQTGLLPYTQHFDSVQPPALPPGWSSTQNRQQGANDFTTSTATPRSAPHAAGSTNATISQALISPVFDFSGLTPDTLTFYIRRSATHTARMLVEASLDSGVSYTLQLGDSLRLTAPNAYAQIKLPLPSALASSRSVRFRWRIVGDPTGGTTATLRIDDVTINARRPADVAMTHLRFLPSSPVEQAPVTAIAHIRNVGEEAAQGVIAEFYVDANNDSLPQPSELRATALHSGTLAPRDSVELSANIGTFPPSSQLVIARAVFPPDQYPANNQRHASLIIGYRAGSVVVNEIMYAPSGAEPEWVEVMNAREDTINIKDWLLSDNVITTKRLITSSPVRIPPGGFVVLTRDSTALAEIHPTIPSRVISVSGFPSLNNSGDAVVLYDQRGSTMDSVAYLPSWGGSGGSSLERRDHLSSSTVQGNWGSSRHALRSTPGMRNSIARRTHDLALDSLRVTTALPVAHQPFITRLHCRNIGRVPASQFTLQIFLDANADSLIQSTELIAEQSVASPIPPLDSLTLSIQLPGLRAGTHQLFGRIHFAADEDTSNNISVVRLTVGHPPGVVRINEIMYAPPGGMPEWVELVNVSADTVDLARWLVGNRSTSSRYEITGAALAIAPDSLLVITKDTALFRQAYPSVDNVIQSGSLPTFLWSNNGDAVVLLDSRRVRMDSVFYAASWGVAGRSLERIDPLGEPNDSTNWAASVDSLGGTPGRRNINVLRDRDVKLLRLHADTTLPGTVMRIQLSVQNAGRMPLNEFDVQLFHDANRDSLAQDSERFYMQRVVHSLARGDSVMLRAEWPDPPAGIHRIIARVIYQPDERPANNEMHVRAVVGFRSRTLLINEFMFAPLSGGAEYVEFYNAGTSDVDVAEWRFRDRPGTTQPNVFKLSSTPKQVRVGEMFVLASDSSVLKLYSTAPDERLLTILNTSSLSLNNDGDDIVLIDPTGQVIDSLNYLPEWHNASISDKSGRALEKLSPMLESSDRRSWTTAVARAGGTPGRANSVQVVAPVARSAISILPNPFSPDGDGREDAAIIAYELPLTTAMIRVRIFDSIGRHVRTLANNEPSGSSGSIVWDGNDDGRNRVRVGLYIVLLEAIDEKGGIVESAKGVVVVAAKM